MSVRETVEAGGKAVADGINNKDAASIANLYTQDASLFPPGAPRQDGREAAQDFLAGRHRHGARRCRVDHGRG